ncbi:leucine-rich repeat extensin-like protein 3 [Punica granatum]|uniref:Leucine-rich repeat extensin-like protein 3 n=1 Tax=Punica granatum TaxID=22663 RepID=A0A6P8C9M5_PUNGR|nr:leucine-rich repeat extensin-like protein 3 [Punica granatum]
MEGPNGKGEESSKKVPATTSSSGGRRGKEVSVNAVNPTQPTPQQYSVNFATSPTAAPAYFPPPPQHQHQSVYYSAPPGPSPMASQPFDHHYATAPTSPRPPVSRAPPPAQQNPTSQGRDEDAQDNPLPFVIDYTPDEPTVGFAGRMASPAPFVVDIPAREPYADSKVPWTYEGSVGSVEQQFSVMGMTSSGWAYENPVAKDSAC